VKSFRLFARRLSIVAAATVAGTAGILAFTTTPAFAHHTSVSGVPVCNPETGNFEIKWIVTNSESDKTATLKQVRWTPDDAPPTNIFEGAFLPKHGANAPDPDLTGQQVLPGTATSASLTVLAKWDNGFREKDPQSATVTMDGACKKNHPNPHASFQSKCDGLVIVTLSNDEDATASAHFTVFGEGTLLATETVAAGGSKTVTVPADKAGAIVVKEDGVKLEEYAWVEPDDCAPVLVSHNSTCDKLLVNVENPTGNRPKTFTIVSGEASETFTLAGGEDKDFEYPGGAGVKATVTQQGANEGVTVEWENPGSICNPPTTTTPPLPVTGTSLTSLIGVGGALVLVGAALLFVLRFRRRLGES